MDLDTIADTTATKIAAVGNLPYGISSQILIKLVQSRSKIDRAVLMFQKELAQRIAAKLSADARTSIPSNLVAEQPASDVDG